MSTEADWVEFKDNLLRFWVCTTCCQVLVVTGYIAIWLSAQPWNFFSDMFASAGYIGIAFGIASFIISLPWLFLPVIFAIPGLLFNYKPSPKQPEPLFKQATEQLLSGTHEKK